MVESLKELNKIVQKPRYREVGNWYVRKVLRDAALPMTWLLLHTPVSANQVTLASLVVAMGSTLALALPGTGWFLGGVLLLQFWYYLDHVDGQIARYKKTSSLTGRFYDFIMHHFVHSILLFGLGCYAYFQTQEFFFLLLGFGASLGILFFNLVHDTKYKTYFEKLETIKKTTGQMPEIASSPTASRNDPSVIARELPDSPKQPLGKKVFSIAHKLCEIHVMMNILTFAAVLEWLGRIEMDFRFPLFVTYAILIPTLAVFKITYWILTKKIDQDFENDYQPRT